MDRARRPRILIADDDPQLLELHARRLQSIGDYDVQTAQRGEEALDVLRDSVDLAILDLQMPGTSGTDLIRHIEDADLELPVVVISGQEPDLEYPVDEFLCKPIHLEDFQTLLERHLPADGNL